MLGNGVRLVARRDVDNQQVLDAWVTTDSLIRRYAYAGDASS